MHKSVMQWMDKIVERYELADRRTLEVGSKVWNGTVRSFFRAHYVGCDLEPGVGVDAIADAENLTQWTDGEWATVVSTELLEHCARPWRAVAEMARVCEPQGYVVVTCRGFDRRGCWEVHGYPQDYYRFSATAMRVLAEDAGLKVVELETDPEGPGWLMVAQKL